MSTERVPTRGGAERLSGIGVSRLERGQPVSDAPQRLSGGPDENTVTDGSPFHQGERAIQERVGNREKIEGYGRRGIRDFMPDQHREFFAQLRMFLIGVTDAQQRPWASALFGEPGFVHSPDPKRLHVAIPATADHVVDNSRRGSYQTRT